MKTVPFFLFALLSILPILGTASERIIVLAAPIDSFPFSGTEILLGGVRVWARLMPNQCENRCELVFLDQDATYHIDGEMPEQFGDYEFFSTGNWNYSVQCVTTLCNGFRFTSYGTDNVYLVAGYSYNLEITLAADNALFLNYLR